MKKLKIGILVCGLVLVCALYIMFRDYNGHKFEVDGIYYELVDDISNLVQVTYKGRDWDVCSNEYSGSLEIPNVVTYRHREYTVSEIGNNAFRDCGSLTSIAIPSSVWHIGQCAFDGCDALKEIHISDLLAWCEMSFWDILDDIGGSPFHYADDLYLNGELIIDRWSGDINTVIGLPLTELKRHLQKLL